MTGATANKCEQRGIGVSHWIGEGPWQSPSQPTLFTPF